MLEFDIRLFFARYHSFHTYLVVSGLQTARNWFCPGERVLAITRRVREGDKNARDYAKMHRSMPRPRACEITEATFSNECLLMANQTLAAYSLVAEGSIALKSLASP